MFVTGLPGSGTTWVFAVLEALGMDAGDDVVWSSGRKGGEFRLLRDYSLELHGWLLGHVEPESAPWPFDDIRRRDWIDTHPLPDLPELVKSPGWGVCRLYEEYEVRSVLVVRPMDGWLESLYVNRRTMNHFDADRLGCAATAAVERMRGTVDVVLEWPRALHDPAYMSRTLGVDVSAGVHVTNPEWVSF